jgi:hypothetical protein
MWVFGRRTERRPTTVEGARHERWQVARKKGTAGRRRGDEAERQRPGTLIGTRQRVTRQLLRMSRFMGAQLLESIKQ